MRFSLKWILFAAVYVAVAAAAFSQDSWVYADLLWVASLLAVVFAALLAFMGRGKGRVAAAGFALASLAFVACVAFGQISGSDVVPTKRWLVAAGYDPNLVSYYPVAASSVPPVYQSSGSVFFPNQSPTPAPSSSAYSLSFTPTAIQPPAAVNTVAAFGIYVRAANAVGMMLFGALGAIVGLFAFKWISQPSTM